MLPLKTKNRYNMKFLRLLILALTAGVIFSSCQKELSAETGTALGTLAKDAAGDCAPIGINGAYKQDTVLNATNFVDIQLDVTQVGVYIISTDTVNGYYFRATGVTPLPGANSIRLVGFGKPIAVGTDVFTVKFGGTECEFNVNVTLGTGGGGVTTAVFTFPNGTPCAGATQTPNFFVGLPTSATTHTITLLVNVTTAGSYNLSTTLANGLIFSGTGSLSVGNNQPIVLGASGTPGTAGPITYTFSTTTPVASSCGFDLTVQAAPTPAVYTFNCGSTTFAGTYQVGTAMTSANTITVPVTVTTPGSYNITTTVNGVTFSGSNVLTATSTSITLTATGTPTAAAAPSTVFTLTGGGSCPITIPFTTGGGGATDFIQCQINGGAMTTFNVGADAELLSVFGFNTLTMLGENVAGGADITFDIVSTSAITAGSYNVNQIFPVVTGTYTDATGNVFEDATDGTTHSAPVFTIVITTITATRITGTFSGRLYPVAPATGNKDITNGSFSLLLP
jgi:hypothetical protein